MSNNDDLENSDDDVAAEASLDSSAHQIGLLGEDDESGDDDLMEEEPTRLTTITELECEETNTLGQNTILTFQEGHTIKTGGTNNTAFENSLQIEATLQASDNSDETADYLSADSKSNKPVHSFFPK